MSTVEGARRTLLEIRRRYESALQKLTPELRKSICEEFPCTECSMVRQNLPSHGPTRIVIDQSDHFLLVLVPEVDVRLPNHIREISAISSPRYFLLFWSIGLLRLMMSENFLDEIVRYSLEVPILW
jgi:hypothetical protein